MKHNKPSTSYFLEKIFPEFIRFFFGALLLLVGTWLAKTTTGKDQSDIPLSFGINQNIVALIYILISIYAAKYIFSSVRNLIIAQRDSIQLNYSPSNEFPLYDEHQELYKLSRFENDGEFNYRVSYYSSTSVFETEIETLDDVSNPRCMNSECLTELIERKTKLNAYRFYCPSCGIEYKSKYSSDTLRMHFYLVLESRYHLKSERMIDERLPF